MAGSLDSCINNIYEPGSIPASSGTPPVRVLLRDPFEVSVSEAAAALDSIGIVVGILVTVSETTTATDTQTATLALVPRSAMLPDVFVNSSGTPRQANANGVMVNL
jgi:hypothetical protein